MKITGIIIAKNEEGLIGEALKSIKWCDEVLLIDSGSTDKTIAIAKKEGARVVISTGKNYADWRNKGLKEATGDWVLFIDADERIIPELKAEIQKVISEPSRFSWFVIPRRNYILDKEFKHCGQWPDYVKRLFRREAISSWTGEVHEEPVVEGDMGKLKNPLIHIKHETFTEMVEKTNQYSEYEAKLMFEAHHPPMNVPRFISAMLREFWKRMIIQVAFLDGPKGIMYAMYQVFSRFVSYAKLWEMQLKEGIV